MIVDRIERAHIYNRINPHFKDVFDFIACKDFINHPVEVSQVNEVCTVYLQRFISKANEKNIYENHRKFIDIHFVISGTEQIGYAGVKQTGTEESGQYDPDGDIEFFDCKGTILPLLPGELMIVFPGELHAPKAHSVPGKEIIKIVAKIPAN